MHVFTFGNPTCKCGAQTVPKSDLDRAEAHYREGRQRLAALAEKLILALDPEERGVVATLVKIRHEEFLDDLVACADAFDGRAHRGRPDRLDADGTG